MEEDYKTNKNLFDGVNKDITAEQCLEAYILNSTNGLKFLNKE
jgi:hypothetical protein